MKIKDVIEYMEAWAPLAYQESYDNAGLQVGDPDMELKGGLVCLDVTPERVEEAVAAGANLIVSHHPVLFHPLRQVCGIRLSERVVIAAIRNGVAIYSAHTNLDNVRSGVNAALAAKLGLTITGFLQPMPGVAEAGGGAIGELPSSMEEEAFLAHVKSALELPVLRHSRLRGRPVRKVALCGGAGGFMLPDAIRSQADAFLVGEAHYHDFNDFSPEMLILETGHHESECWIKSVIFDKLNGKFGTFALSKTERTPYYYW